MEEYVNLLIRILTTIFGILVLILKETLRESILRKSKKDLFLQFLMKSDAVKRSNDIIRNKILPNNVFYGSIALYLITILSFYFFPLEHEIKALYVILISMICFILIVIIYLLSFSTKFSSKNKIKEVRILFVLQSTLLGCFVYPFWVMMFLRDVIILILVAWISILLILSWYLYFKPLRKESEELVWGDLRSELSEDFPELTVSTQSHKYTGKLDDFLDGNFLTLETKEGTTAIPWEEIKCITLND